MYEHHDEVQDVAADDDHDGMSDAEAVEVEQIRTGRFVSEQDLAMYAAITGRRPVVEIVRERPNMRIGHVVYDAPRGVAGIFTSARNHQKVTVWIRSMSINARRKIGEAALRLAS